MDNCYGQHGWREFHTNRESILSEYDKLLAQTANRPVQVAHGSGVEAYLRSWFGEFLPKKYGVTSGYIIPSLYDDSETIYHYDIIIYNYLEAPVLWTEGNRDDSEQGKYRAIPAEHVIAVYEVKSRLTKENVSDAYEKLVQIEKFQDQLNPFYSCGVVFIELKESDNNRPSIPKELAKGAGIFGFSGGMVLRYEGDHSCTGLLEKSGLRSDETTKKQRLTPIAKPIDELNMYLQEDGNICLAESGGAAKFVYTSGGWAVSKQYGVYCRVGNQMVSLIWSRTNFADFCIHLISRLEGRSRHDSKRPSFGQIFDFVKRKKAPLQPKTIEEGKPYISVEPYDGDDPDEKLSIETSESEGFVSFTVSVENLGDSTAVISDDGFNTKCELPAGAKAQRLVSLKSSVKILEGDLADLLRKEPLVVIYRLVYYPLESDKEFLAVENVLKITESTIEFCNADSSDFSHLTGVFRHPS